jgi:23S rRNA pseudouridine2604 synthase
LREGNDKKKEYIVTVNKSITSNFIRSMSEGVKIYNPVKNEYTVTQKCEVSKINDRTFKIILSQGLNRQIRRMCTALEYKVINLKRIKIMDLTLEGLNTGEWRNLTSQEIENLKT